ncbi:unnamed protein product [Durusdinium trenchii]|uniref:Uncharacterized protein n=1 Tax=Durusdinium trenchii TaxID=1381693 RepID=A0ABP0LVG8_9DINO
MVLAICPVLAGDGILNGLRGEARRIEDKFTNAGMELKNVSICFDTSGCHGNRTAYVNIVSIPAYAECFAIFTLTQAKETIAPRKVVVCDMMSELQSEAYLACYSECFNPTIFNFAVTQEWKTGTGLMGSMAPKFQKEPDLSDVMEPRLPVMKLCKLNPDWRVRLKNFDSIFAESSRDAAEIQVPTAADAERDLGEAPAEPVETPDASTTCEPPSMTAAEFRTKYPESASPLVVTLNLGPGQPVTCTFVDGKVYLSSTANTRILGACTANARPLDFMSKEANANKAVEFNLSSSNERVVLEEQTSTGLQDVGPMSVYQLLVSFEKRGHLDLKLTGHQCERPPEVQRGERSDAINVTQVEHSVFKPNAVLPAKAKGTNIAGVIGVKCLAASEFLVLLWRSLGIRHYSREKVLGPAKPLWFARADIVLRADHYYQVA